MPIPRVVFVVHRICAILRETELSRRRLKKGKERNQTEISDPISAANCKSTEGRNPQIQDQKDVKSIDDERGSDKTHRRCPEVVSAIVKLRP